MSLKPGFNVKDKVQRGRVACHGKIARPVALFTQPASAVSWMFTLELTNIGCLSLIPFYCVRGWILVVNQTLPVISSCECGKRISGIITSTKSGI